MLKDFELIIWCDGFNGAELGAGIGQFEYRDMDRKKKGKRKRKE